MKFCFLRQVERISHQKTSKNAKKTQCFSGTLKNRSNPQRCAKYQHLAVQLEYPPCHQNNTSHYIILVSKELEKEPATSKKQRIYQKLEKASNQYLFKRNLKRNYTTNKKQGFCQKLGKASHQCLFRRNVRRKNNKRRTRDRTKN